MYKHERAWAGGWSNSLSNSAATPGGHRVENMVDFLIKIWYWCGLSLHSPEIDLA